MRRPQFLSKEVLLQITVALLSTLAAVVMVHNVALLTQAERFVGDLRIATLLPPEPQDPDIVIAAIEESTLQKFPYRSPVDRAFLSNLLQTLAARGPRAIGMDILFDQPTEPAKDAALKQTIADLKIPLAVSYTSNPEIVDAKQLAYLDAFVPPNRRVAAEIASDAFGTARWILPSVKESDGSTLPSFARGLLQRAGVATPAVQREMVWHGRPNADTAPFRIFPAELVPILPAAWFKNKIVLIGEIVSLTDRHRTPFASVYGGTEGSLPGIEIHANAVSQLLHHVPSRDPGLGAEVALVLLMAAIGAATGAAKLALGPRIGLSVLAPALLWVSGFALFRFTGVSIVLISPTIASAISQWATDLLTGRQERRQRAFIQTAFARYLSPVVVAQLVKDPKRLRLEGEGREMSFLFTDIEGFTSLSEKMQARDVAEMLNAYLDGVCAAILALDGTVDKFIGDAVFAIFNAPADQPDHANRAVKCALAIDRFSEVFRAEQRAKGIALGMTRIGVHSGHAVVGNFGSHTRMQYTALGDTVNTASRLEGVNKYFGTRMCISEATCASVSGIPFRPIAVIVPKGREEPLGIFEPLDEERAASPYIRRYLEAYALAERRNPRALALFEELHRTNPDDKCVALHLERLRESNVGVEMVMHDK
ncbi:MAG TPA: adenylate/guanylate cyclase domain-containing protein [Stellaceae bacterium]|nr:adenylate/guanylate cyclase domain-containing protein [Stellaceae bacterium]